MNPHVRQHRVASSIRRCHEQGRVALVPCVIPGFPAPARSRALVRMLDESPLVAALEVTWPASDTFSDTANATIVRANKTAATQGIDHAAIGQVLQLDTPSFVMLYRETVERLGFDHVLELLTPSCEDVFLEWEPDDLAPFVRSSARSGVDLLSVFVPVMTDAVFTEELSRMKPGALVYFECASQAGSARAPVSILAERIDAIKTRQPEASLIASMGIRTPGDVAEVVAIPGIDAVAVGTGFFDAFERGTDALSEYLSALAPALHRRPSAHCA